ncbi:hypothetical protein [Neobacillus drentensis]|nr:hypothetical protein [Neobacillus drentensis]MDR7235491.1 hypothetical protein [Neobacillus drentensis]
MFFWHFQLPFYTPLWLASGTAVVFFLLSFLLKEMKPVKVSRGI